MVIWAALFAFVIGVVTYFLSEPAMLLMNLAEVGGVFALFGLVCAAEAFN